MNSTSIEELKNLYGNITNLKELSLNRFDIAGNLTTVDLAELSYVPNLESLILSNLNISVSDISYINSLKNLKSIAFINCDFEDSKGLITLNLETIMLDNSVVDEEIFNHQFRNIVFKNMPVKYHNLTTNILDIKKAEGDITIIDYSFINNIIISEKQFNNYKEFFIQLLNEKHIVVKDKYDEEIKIDE